MRVHLALLAGVGFILASACGDSSTGTTSGTSGGTTAGTTGGTTGGTTTGGTTGGTTSGGTTGGLAAGADCTGNTQCASSVCGAHGSGKCCTAACSTTDSICGATDCNATGACLYPATTTACGAAACNSGQLTPSACNGSGVCTPGAAAPCPGNFQCADASSCRTQCNLTLDCQTGFYCDTTNHQCLAPQATGACTTNEACTSGVCGIAGTGNCCTAACGATADPACTATSCDVASGACVYPSGNACGTSTCTGSTLTAGSCDPVGACNPATGPCPANLVCDPAGSACLPACATTADCVTGFYCNAAHCIPQVAVGPCTTNEACTTGICGAHGAGHCCTAACDTTDVACGARDCDNVGACVFPNNKTTCGTPAGCTGSTQTDPTTCDGAGVCLPQNTTDCTPYVCGAKACLTSCKGSSSCVAGDFCDTGTGSCCSGLAKGGSISVDSVNGSDATTCCGIGGNGACQTLAHAMTLIDSAQVSDVTINATVNGGGGDWTGETYPVTLGWGVELNAPGVFFLDLNVVAGPSIFDVNASSKSDTIGYASIVGSGKSTIGVGLDSAGNQTDATAAIAVESGHTLYIANASVNGSFDVNTHEDSFEAILVAGGAGLMLGQDQSGGITGTVFIGNGGGQSTTDGYQGIFCDTDPVNMVGCTIQDAALGGQSSVIIQGQEGGNLDISDFGSVTLSSNPVFGVAPSGPGFKNCPSKEDGISGSPAFSIRANGQVTLALTNATIQCSFGAGLLLEATSNGSPSVTLDTVTIQNTDLGISAGAGTVKVTNSTIAFNYNGVQQATDSSGKDGTIDLSGGGNTVVCSSNAESSTGNTNPGISVYNTSTSNLAADNTAWDTTGPDYFDCDPAFTSCVCNLGSCTVTAGSDGMDAVEDSTNVGGVTTTGNTLSGISCN